MGGWLCWSFWRHLLAWPLYSSSLYFSGIFLLLFHIIFGEMKTTWAICSRMRIIGLLFVIIYIYTYLFSLLFFYFCLPNGRLAVGFWRYWPCSQSSSERTSTIRGRQSISTRTHRIGCLRGQSCIGRYKDRHDRSACPLTTVVLDDHASISKSLAASQQTIQVSNCLSSSWASLRLFGADVIKRHSWFLDL